MGLVKRGSVATTDLKLHHMAVPCNYLCIAIASYIAKLCYHHTCDVCTMYSHPAELFIIDRFSFLIIILSQLQCFSNLVHGWLVS